MERFVYVLGGECEACAFPLSPLYFWSRRVVWLVPRACSTAPRRPDVTASCTTKSYAVPAYNDVDCKRDKYGARRTYGPSFLPRCFMPFLLFLFCVAHGQVKRGKKGDQRARGEGPLAKKKTQKKPSHIPSVILRTRASPWAWTAAMWAAPLMGKGGKTLRKTRESASRATSHIVLSLSSLPERETQARRAYKAGVPTGKSRNGSQERARRNGGRNKIE